MDRVACGVVVVTGAGVGVLLAATTTKDGMDKVDCEG